VSLRVLIVDDERLARDKLRAFLAGEPEVELVGEAASGDEAVERIRALAPDVLFLDVHMPGRSGFEVLAAVAAAPMAVVFVTAHDGYAVRAFEVEARDYLLKPFDRARFRRALERARAQVRPLARLMVREGERIRFLPVEEIDWIEAADNYVVVHVGAAEHLLRETLASLEARLAGFARVHRRALVNLAAVLELRAGTVALRGGAAVPVGRSHREAFLARMR
jgi:two-component system LytT family response regulator